MSSAKRTIDHREIRAWAEKNGGRPSCVRGTGSKGDPGMLRIEFDEKSEKLEEISWDTWFEWFDRNELALLHSEDGRFTKLVSRTGEEEEQEASELAGRPDEGNADGRGPAGRDGKSGREDRSFARGADDRAGADDLKSREYRDKDGTVHHHTRTYQEQHRDS